MAIVIEMEKYRRKKITKFGTIDVQRIADENLKYRCPYLIYDIVYSNSMYKRLGFCTCKTKGNYKYATLKFSLPFFKACQETGNYEEIIDTVLHEIGHAIVYYAYGAGHGHDNVWKDIMLMLGGRPEMCRNIDFFKRYNEKYGHIVTGASTPVQHQQD